MGATPLPGSTLQARRDRRHQPVVGIGGDQLDPGQAAGVQAAEQGQPAGLGLGRADVDAEDLAVPVSVDAGGDQDVGVDHPATLTDLHRQRVRGHERIRALVQRAGPEGLHMLVELSGHHRDL